MLTIAGGILLTVGILAAGWALAAGLIGLFGPVFGLTILAVGSGIVAGLLTLVSALDERRGRRAWQEWEQQQRARQEKRDREWWEPLLKRERAGPE